MKLLRFLLFPFAILYDVITSIRNWLFDVGILKSTSFQIPVIAVGNLSVGGTGKTPQIEYLIRLLQDDYKVAVLSRGYKRKTKRFIKLDESHTAADVGDEPLQFFKKFGNEIIVAVDANRVNGIQQLLKGENPPQVVLLDDAYQHRKVKATHYCLLTKYSELFTDDFILPTGNLRESKRGYKRADSIIVTKCPVDVSEKEKQIIQSKIYLKSHQSLYFTAIKYNSELIGDEKITLQDLQEYKVVLVTGIASPESLKRFLMKNNVDFKHLKFSDHHHFTETDIYNINNCFNKVLTKKSIILTTEKDYTRLSGRLENLYYITIESVFIDRKKEFDNTVNKLLTKLKN